MRAIIHPSVTLLCGQVGVGKTHFVVELINRLSDESIKPRIKKIIWIYSEENAKPKNIQFRNIIFTRTIPDNFENPDNIPTLIVFDDFQNVIVNSVSVCDLIIRTARHNNISCFLLLQNIFCRGKYIRDISLQAKYLVIFKNARDNLQFSYLARQIAPENYRELMRVYKECTQRRYGYIFIDLHPSTPDALKFRTNIFDKYKSVVYCPDNILNESNGIIKQSIGEKHMLVIRVSEC